MAVYKVKNKFRKISKNVQRKPSSEKAGFTRTLTILLSIMDKIRYNPVRYMGNMAREVSVRENTIRMIVHEDLGAILRTKTKNISLTRKLKGKD